MILEVLLRSLIPILLLTLVGFFTRAINIFRQGDERVFAAYVFYLALPALFFVNMSELVIQRSTVIYMIATAMPPIVLTILYFLICLIFRVKKEHFYFLIFSTVFGSYAFFGIPFMLFAFPGLKPEALSVLSSASISIVGVFLTIFVLELYSMNSKSYIGAISLLAKKFLKNPLILSILLGILCSLSNISIPQFLSSSLHMLGSTTATVSLFMLGLFLYGRKYESFPLAFILTFLRAFLMPLVAVISMNIFGIQGLPATISILMAAMPVAISMIVLSERYDFFKEQTATLTLVSTLSSVIYLPLWIIFLGTR